MIPKHLSYRQLQAPSASFRWLIAIFLPFMLTSCGILNNAMPASNPEPTSTPLLPPTDVPAATIPLIPSPTPSPIPPPPATETPLSTEGGVNIQPLPPSPARVEQLLQEMTLEQKVGQLMLVYFVGPELSPDLMQMINEYHVGGILLFSASDNVRSLAQVAQLLNDAQREAVTHGVPIPLLVGLDQEGGSVVRLRQGATIPPSHMALGATYNVENAHLMAQVMALELKALGINMNLAPVVDVNSNPANPVIGIRSFGSSPTQVAAFGQALIQRYQANGILATAKHFPGHGDTSVDSHVGLPVVPHEISRLEEIELYPFQAAVDQQVGAIMTAHVLFPAFEPTSGLPATLSANVLQGLLRDKMGFEGLIVTDSLGMGALVQNYSPTEAATKALIAGADILAFGADTGHPPSEQRPVFDRLIELVHTGAIPESRLDDSVRRILLTKEQYGLLDWEPTNITAIPQRVGIPAHQQTALQIAQKSITLVKDETSQIPLGTEQPTLVISLLGLGNVGNILELYHPNMQRLSVSVDPTAAEIEQAIQMANNASKVIVTTAYAGRHPAQVQLVNTLLPYNPIVIALGTPYDLLNFPTVPTYLATYGDVPVSIEAAANVLIGRVLPQGQLPVELPGLYSVGHGMVIGEEGR